MNATTTPDTATRVLLTNDQVHTIVTTVSQRRDDDADRQQLHAHIPTRAGVGGRRL